MLITAIMPTTKKRLAVLPLAIEGFLKQVGAVVPRRDLELLIVTEDPEVVTLAESYLPRFDLSKLTIRMCRPGLTVAAKRNWACAEASGTWVMFWDDDDWISPNRIRQTLPFMKDDVDLVGSRVMTIHEIVDPRRRTYLFEYPVEAFKKDPYFVGGLLTFRKTLWQTMPFDSAVAQGEDGWWVIDRLKEGARFADMGLLGGHLYVAMRHESNTGNTQTPSGDPWWGLLVPESLPIVMGEDAVAAWEAAHQRMRLSGAGTAAT